MMLNLSYFLNAIISIHVNSMLFIKSMLVPPNLNVKTLTLGFYT